MLLVPLAICENGTLLKSTVTINTPESKEYSIGRYPAPAPWFQGLLDKTKSSYLDSHLKELMGEYYTVFNSLQNMKGQNPIQARTPYYINIK